MNTILLTGLIISLVLNLAFAARLSKKFWKRHICASDPSEKALKPPKNNDRPDLSFITSQSFKSIRHYVEWRSGLDFKKDKVISKSNVNLPQLISIAEMYYDSMLGTPAEKGFTFKIVSDTLNEIAKG